MPKPARRGREADSPREIPRPGWKEILLRVKDEIAADHVSVVAAGVAFYGLLALFPAIAAVISIAGFILDPAQMETQIADAAAMLPQDAASILTEQARKAADAPGTGGWVAAVGGLLLTLYSASLGVRTLMEGLNIAYDEKETRGFLTLYATGLLLTLVLAVGFVLAVAATVAAPAVLGFLGLGGGLQTAISWGRWLVLAAFAILALAVLFRYGPSRSNARWRWITPGALAATLLWMLGSALFSVYVANFGSYNQTYGALGGVIILMTWLWLSAFIVLLGAELNAEMEHQTEADTTTGAWRPMGARGAVKADTPVPRPDEPQHEGRSGLR